MSFKKHCIPLLAVLLMWLSLFLEVNREGPCTVDEPAWISTSYLTFGLVSEIAPISRWETAYKEAQLGDWGNKNPPIGKIILGAVVAMVKNDSDTMRYSWDWKQSYLGNQKSGSLPPLHLLSPARHAIAVMGALVLLFVYIIAFQLTKSAPIALFAPIILFLIPVFQVHAVRVYMDIPQLCFLLASVVGFLSYLNTNKTIWFVLSLVLLGLSCAVKFSSGPAVAALILYLLVRRSSWRKKALHLCAALVLPFLIFTAVNPYLYPQPIGRTVKLISGWETTKENQRGDPVLARQAIPSPLVGVIAATARGVLKPTMTPPFRSKMLDRLQTHVPMLLGLLAAGAFMLALLDYRLTLVSSRKKAILLGSLFLLGAFLELWLFKSGGLTTGLFFMGITGIIWRLLSRKDMSKRETSGRAYFSILFLSTLVITGVWLPFDWARYYLPVIVLTAVLGTLGIHFGLQTLETRKKTPPLLEKWTLAKQGYRVSLGTVVLMFLSLIIFIVTGPML